jgi:hypothetical protein
VFVQNDSWPKDSDIGKLALPVRFGGTSFRKPHFHDPFLEAGARFVLLGLLPYEGASGCGTSSGWARKKTVTSSYGTTPMFIAR